MGYWQSISTLEHAKKSQLGIYTKTSLMLQGGDSDNEGSEIGGCGCGNVWEVPLPDTESPFSGGVSHAGEV